MKRSVLARIVAVVALAVVAFSTIQASADHCGANIEARNAHDPFGSCEQNNGTPRCGSTETTTDVSTLGRIIVSDQGVQFCWDERHSSFPMRGRLSVYNSEGHLGVGADGDETHNAQYGTNGFVRLDIETGTGRACFYFSQGTWWTPGGQATGAVACAPAL